MKPDVLHLHTFFIFPFSIDQNAVMQDHPGIWGKDDQWFNRLDQWVTAHVVPEHQAVASRLPGWKRQPHSRFEMHTSAYQDMVFFHPFVRRAFFDNGGSDTNQEALVHTYVMRIAPGHTLHYQAESHCGGRADVEITSIRLLLFANGISMLVLGIEAQDISFSHALWINEMMRKIYPSSDRQIASGRIPYRMALLEKADGRSDLLVEECFEHNRLVELRPQLSKVLLSLLHFADYAEQEFEPILDERMVVSSFVRLNAAGLPPGYECSEAYDVDFSRFLYVDRDGEGYRYERDFTRRLMEGQVYRRWQHQGTLYGVTNYSNITAILATPERRHANDLVYRMFRSKNHLIALIALFYRSSLLDFAKESALVSRQLFPVFSGQVVRHHHIRYATKLMADFHYFNNYWFFDELTTKDEELKHFNMFREAYRLGELKTSIGEQIEKLADYMNRLYALRSNDAVNRLAMMSVILGVGALVTGFYGMNIPSLEEFLKVGWISTTSLIATSGLALASVAFIIYIILSNWIDYRASIFPHRYRKSERPNSLRRLSISFVKEDEDDGENAKSEARKLPEQN